MDVNRRAAIISAIGRRGGPDSSAYLQQVCAAAVDLLDLGGAGITLMSAAQWGEVWASGGSSQALEDLQFALEEGPALDAFRFGKPALEPDLGRASSRWPFFSPRALDLGIRAVFAFPLQVGAIRLGALDLFRDSPGFLSRADLADALVLAEVVTQDIIDLEAQGVLYPALSDPLGNRARVHEATGMVAVQAGSDMAGALARIRAYAFANEMSIFDVADQVIERRLRLDSPPA